MSYQCLSHPPQLQNVQLILFIFNVTIPALFLSTWPGLEIPAQKNTAAFSQLLQLLTKTKHLSLAQYRK
jgi:hypothetical protein